MQNVLFLLSVSFAILIFAIIGLEFYSGALHKTCYSVDDLGNFFYGTLNNFFVLFYFSKFLLRDTQYIFETHQTFWTFIKILFVHFVPPKSIKIYEKYILNILCSLLKLYFPNIWMINDRVYCRTVLNIIFQYNS